MPKRLLGVVVIALAAVAAGSAPALACDTADISAGGSAAPGDTVPWTAAGLESGARWVVSVSGVGTVASGTASADGTVARGTFTMPPRDGSAKGVSVELTIEHDDFTNGDPSASRSSWTAYPDAAAPAPAPVTTQSQSPAPQSSAAPAAGPEQAPTAVPQRPAPSGGTTSAKPPQRHAVAAPVHHAVRPRSVPRHAVTRRAPAAVVRGLPSEPAVATSPVDVARRGSSRHHERAAPAVSSPAHEASPRLQTAAVAVARAQAPAPPVAWLLAIAVVAIGGSLLALLARRRGRPGTLAGAVPAPVPVEPARDDAALEAELQELLAEEHARAVLADERRHAAGRYD
jgi:hypothetical protein